MRTDFAVGGADGLPEGGRSLGLVTGHERAQQPVVDLGLEDRKANARSPWTCSPYRPHRRAAPQTDPHRLQGAGQDRT
jgi:hypothetical protein